VIGPSQRPLRNTTFRRQTAMTQAGIEPTIQANERPLGSTQTKICGRHKSRRRPAAVRRTNDSAKIAVCTTLPHAKFSSVGSRLALQSSMQQSSV